MCMEESDDSSFAFRKSVGLYELLVKVFQWSRERSLVSDGQLVQRTNRDILDKVLEYSKEI